MILTCGTRIGPYEIVAPLGAGGMGEVYRAHDPRLGRDVALKVLRGGIGDRRRFEREARSASSLNHANILTIYDIGEADGAPYIVSELLEGESLRARLGQGTLSVRTLLDIGTQAAAGLSAAHAHDIAHRDLKPENIMVLADGRVKILDFGLAKPVDPTADDDNTCTAQGLLMGTIPYMSPEQVQGQPVDTRSDQFSLGVILFEMATGMHPFRGADRVTTMSAIAHKEPAPAGALNIIPAPLRWLIERCLAKEPSQRFTSTADLCSQLKDIRDHISDVLSIDPGSPVVSVAAPKPKSRFSWVRALVSAALVLAAFVAGAALTGRFNGVRVYHYTPFATAAVDETSPSWSRDGSTIAYSAIVDGVSQVFARRLNRSLGGQITFSSQNCEWPFWSADGSRIYYWSSGALWDVGAAGGEPRQIASDVERGYPPAAISPDGSVIAYFRSGGANHTVHVLRLRDGASTLYAHFPFPGRFRLTGGMRFSFDGSKLLVWLIPELDRGTEIWILPFPSGTPRRVYSPLIQGYRPLSASWTIDNRHIVVSTEASPGKGSHIYLVDTETGEASHLTSGTSEEGAPAVSPDGDRLAFSNGGPHSDLMEISLDGRRIAPLLATTRRQHSADWSPNGRQFVYVTESDGTPEIWLRSLEEGWERPVIQNTEEGNLSHAVPRLSPDGQKLAYVRIGLNHLIFITNLSGGQAVRLEQESSDQHAPVWSPDGKWIAYSRYIHQQWEIAKAPSGGGGTPQPITTGGGALNQIEWAPTDGAIWFREGQDLYRVPENGGDPVNVAKNVSSFMIPKRGDAVYLVRQDRARGWQLITLDIASGIERQPVPLSLDMDVTVADARLHPDGTHFVLSVTSWRRDIWILDGLTPRSLFDVWFRRESSHDEEGVRH